MGYENIKHLYVSKHKSYSIGENKNKIVDGSASVSGAVICLILFNFIFIF